MFGRLCVTPGLACRYGTPGGLLLMYSTNYGVWCTRRSYAVPVIETALQNRRTLTVLNQDITPPSATIVPSMGDAFGVSRARVGSDCQDRERQGGRDRADMDVLVASPGNHYPSWLPTDNTVGQTLLTKVL